MAKLTAADRRALPASTFAGPGRSFPIPDANHARAALAEIGHAPASAQPAIRARADAMLGHKKKHHANGPSNGPSASERSPNPSLADHSY